MDYIFRLFLINLTIIFSYQLVAKPVEIKTSVNLFPDKNVDFSQFNPQIYDLNNDEELKKIADANQRSFTFTIQLKTKSSTHLLIKPLSELPQSLRDYESSKLTLVIPYEDKLTLVKIPITLVRVQNPLDPINTTNIEIPNPESTVGECPVGSDLVMLLKNYQKSRIIAIKRMDRLYQNWDKLAPPDIRAVNIYLQYVRSLSNRCLLIVPKTELERARNWLYDSTTVHNTKMVKNVLRSKTADGKQNALQIINQTKPLVLTAKRFGYIFNKIKSNKYVSNSNIRYQLLNDLYEELTNKYTGGEEDIIKKNAGVYRVTILSGIAQNLVLTFKLYPELISDPKSKIQDLIDKLELEVKDAIGDLKIEGSTRLQELKDLKNNLNQLRSERKILEGDPTANGQKTTRSRIIRCQKTPGTFIQ